MFPQANRLHEEECPLWPLMGLKSPKFILLKTEDVRPTKTVQTPNFVSFNDWTVIIMTNF